ncbi:MAG: glycine--tRNA ligase, partial [Candidatus Diapherotrites archaeon]|nr:glycine--tRNA ligase [Candidatus Diapherotrites archaeon]
FFNPAKIDEVDSFDELASVELNLFRLNSSVQKISCAEAVSRKIVSGKLVAYLLARVQQLYLKFGIPLASMRFRELSADDRAFYAKETWDFEVEIDGQWIELVACNYRTDYDLRRHSEVSKKDLRVKEGGVEFFPHVFEASAGIDRTFLVSLAHAFRREQRGPEERTFLALPSALAPYSCSVFPLMKKDGLAERATQLAQELREWNLPVFYDEAGSIGKRYARMDEVGVPFAVTVDYDSLQDGTVTLRERDSLVQKRVKISELPLLLGKLLHKRVSFESL